MISEFFINRPVLANVLAIVIVILGAVALATLPVAQYPNIVPPTVQVTTTYPGASAKVVVDNVALPIELQVNGVEGMIYMQSYSTDAGTYTLTVTFAIGTDLDFAQVLVQNRVSAALASLPQAVQDYLLDIQPGFDKDPVRGVYNHGWIIGDESALAAAVQARIDTLLEIQPVDTGAE